MTVSETAELVRAYFAEHASEWKLHSPATRVHYVPSPGGFGAMNFSVVDGSVAYHVRLSETAEQVSNWIRTADRLAARYRAPRLLGQMELAGRYGTIFERLGGETPQRGVSRPVLDQIFPVLAALHGDRELAGRLGGAERQARDTLVQYHLAMCEEDLDEVEAALPLPFVDRAMGAWMREETSMLRERALRSAAFDVPVSNAIHGDLWFGNVLVEPQRFWIIDWDDLKIGDPAHDLSLLSFTALSNPVVTPSWIDSTDAALAERFPLYAQAALLTFVIDPLADWITAEEYPEVRDAARQHRQDLHSWAMQRYRQFYGVKL